MTSLSHVTFDIATTPFSSHGSWMNLSPVIGVHDVSDHVHIVSHRTRVSPVFRLIPSAEDGSWSATESKLTWSKGDASVEFAFQSARQIRIRARETALTLEAVLPRSGRLFSVDSYEDPHDKSIVFTVEETGQRYRVKPLADARLVASRLSEASYMWDSRTPSVTLEASDCAELLVEEIDGATVPGSDFPAFEDVTRAQARNFESYLDTIAGFRSERTPGVAHAAYVNWSMTVSSGGFFTRNTMLMSKHWMDKAWSWDHLFNALAITAIPDDAWAQFWALFDHQTDAGQIPDSVAHSEIRYNYSKPPVHGLLMRPMLDQAPPADLERVYDALIGWTRWWDTAMTAPGEALAHYHFGNDSGWDNSTMFDGFHPLQTPDLNAFLVLQKELLGDLARQLGRPDEAATWYLAARKTLTALMDLLWDGEKFVARHPDTGETRWTQTLLFMMPIVLGNRLPEDVTSTLVAAIASHLTEHGLATERPDSEHYEPDGYWRGPIWAPSTYLIWHGLRESGENELAAQISSRFRAICETSGFAENFDALSGEGLRDRAYTWTASVYLLLAADAELRDTAG